ncbi:Uracil-DNA glycosylase [Ekhidna lutea]|uniref:Uracil-DNA glycosylase n=1 Tax=Ekhidna lutea TaxID=447679 RepID=A0A239H518_EKHLU|nr:uracil-DNA glycosylase family protein [Ekhidna lutea]SNS76312.1 Uracil-DNA glycosylase [Ekhidna lutea]
MESLMKEIRSCTVCSSFFVHKPRPVVAASESAKLLIIGQAPGRKVHESGVPWDDASGRNLRAWLGIDEEVFYDESKVALVPMGFCYPGSGESGDLPPRAECAPLWHDRLLMKCKNVKITLLIGQYAQKYYLGSAMKENLTKTVFAYREYLPKYIPLPHPSPRNRIWMKKNEWFEKDLIPNIRTHLRNFFGS